MREDGTAMLLRYGDFFKEGERLSNPMLPMLCLSSKFVLHFLQRPRSSRVLTEYSLCGVYYNCNFLRGGKEFFVSLFVRNVWIFKSWIEAFDELNRVYSPFSNGFDVANETLTKADRSNPRLHAFFKVGWSVLSSFIFDVVHMYVRSKRYLKWHWMKWSFFYFCL